MFCIENNSKKTSKKIPNHLDDSGFFLLLQGLNPRRATKINKLIM